MTSSIIAMLLTLSSCATHALTIKSITGRYDVKSNRVAHLGDLEEGAFKLFRKNMMSSMQSGDRVIVINSIGGSVAEGDEILELILTEKKEGTRIVCVIDGVAHSMAFNILTRCDVRLATENSYATVHKIRIRKETIENAEALTAVALRAMAKELDEDDEPYRQANSKAMGLSLPDYDLFADQETQWRAPVLLKRGYLHDLVRILP